MLDHVLDLLNPMGGVTARAMFGGHGLYRHGTVFGMIVKDSLYLKADAANREAFTSRGLGPFSYEAKTGQKVAMSYFQAPTEALDDGDEMVRWALCSYEAALRGKTSNARPQTHPPGPRRGRARKLAAAVPPSPGTLGRATAEMAARLTLPSPSSPSTRPSRSRTSRSTGSSTSPSPSASPRPSARVRTPRR